MDDKETVHIFTDTTAFYTLNGPSFLNATRNCTVSHNSTFDPNPAQFAGDEVGF